MTFDGVTEEERERAARLREWAPKPGRWFRRRLATRRERLIRRIVVVAIVVALIATVAVTYVANYRPLNLPHFGYSATRVVLANGRLAPSFPTPGPASQTEWREPTGDFSVDFVVTIDNNGPYPVRVSRVTTWSSSRTPTTAYLDTYDEHGFAGGRPLTPFIVIGHNDQTVAVHVAEHCVASPTRRVTKITSVPVTFSFLGFTHTVGVYVTPLLLQLRTSCVSGA